MLNSTENPLWIDKYVKPYEEQELSMRVDPDMDSPIRSSTGEHHATTNNPYATIQKPRRALPSIHLGEEVGESSDYATIGMATSSNRRGESHGPTSFILSVGI